MLHDWQVEFELLSENGKTYVICDFTYVIDMCIGIEHKVYEQFGLPGSLYPSQCFTSLQQVQLVAYVT